jgi:predicted metalloprotease with PDZ domain
MNTLYVCTAAALLAFSSVRAADSDDSRHLRGDVERELHEAQERLDRAAREVADLSMKLDGQIRAADARAWTSFGPPHAMLGLSVGSSSPEPAEPGSGRGGHGPGGVRVVSVSPGGPADVAGLRADDLIVKLDRTELNGSGGPPRQELLRRIHDLKPDEAITVEYRRDGKLETAVIKPQSLPAFIDGTYLQGLKGLSQGLSNMAISFGSPGAGSFGSAEFLELTPGLGHYFGTEHGLLVVRAPRDARLKLEEGDVVLDIDGRVPSNASHACQIFASYRPGETLKLHIMRQQKKVELAVQMPADTARRWIGRPDFPFTPPTPPVPPAPPAPAAPTAAPPDGAQS